MSEQYLVFNHTFVYSDYIYKCRYIYKYRYDLSNKEMVKLVSEKHNNFIKCGWKVKPNLIFGD